MNNNSTDEAKDKGRIITARPVLVVPNRIAPGFKTILVNNLLWIGDRDREAAIAAGHMIRLSWPGFVAA